MSAHPIPRARVKNRKLVVQVTRCGQNWRHDVAIGGWKPSMPRELRLLPALGDIDQLSTTDGILMDEAAADVTRVRGIFAEFAIHLTPRQRRRVENLLFRATSYIDDARAITMTWSSGFSCSTGSVKGWPLHLAAPAEYEPHILEGRSLDCYRWSDFMRAALQNIRCAEEIVKKSAIARLD